MHVYAIVVSGRLDEFYLIQRSYNVAQFFSLFFFLCLGFTISKVLQVLDTLDRQTFARLQVVNFISYLYHRVFGVLESKENEVYVNCCITTYYILVFYETLFSKLSFFIRFLANSATVQGIIPFDVLW